MIESGQQFGLYVIKEVFSASDTKASCSAVDPFFNREVTLKVYSQVLFPDGKLAQLEALLEKLAVLDHPSIAPIYDSGLEDNTFYYTSARNAGDSLAQRLVSSLPEEEALRIITELTLALDYALDQELGQGKVAAEKIYFDEDGRAVMVDFGIDLGINLITSVEQKNKEKQQEPVGSVAETLHSIGELLLQMLIGSAVDSDERIDDQVAKIANARVRRLVGRFLLPGEWRFASFAELLEELTGFEEVAGMLKSDPPITVFEETAFGAAAEQIDVQDDKQAEKMVAEVRRLVAEKNGLQQALDKAVYERNLAANKQTEGDRQLVLVQQEFAKAKEEANVAWELVAGQKYDRWRPVSWAVGGFVVGFLLSGSYGYYYSEQTRSELLAKLQANEELIKTATWRPAAAPEQHAETTVQKPTKGESEIINVEQAVAEVPPTAVQPEEAVPPVAVQVIPVAEKNKHWWPAGNEFSVTAAIPIEQIKAALGFETANAGENLSDGLQQEVVATVQRWASSWASQDLSSYFSSYSEAYRPELGRSQREWREMRRSRLTRPQWITLDIDDIRVRKMGENRIQVKMKQSYRSDFYQDEIFKSINLIKEEGEWRILMERSLGMVGTADIVGG